MSLIPDGRRLCQITGPLWASLLVLFVFPSAAAISYGADDEQPAKAQETKATEAMKDDKSPPAAQEPVRNPLLDLIKRVKPEKAVSPATPRNPDRNLADPTAPFDRAASTWMTRAITHTKAGEWKQALELLQRVTDQPEDSLYRTESGKWISIHLEADRRRGEAPAEVLADYRAQYDGLARQLLNEAIKSGTPAAFARVARGYFHTDAGHEAADRLGSLHLNRGEFALASRWFAALWQMKPKVTEDSLWRTKAAYAFKQAGQDDLAAELAGSPTPRGNPISLGGKRRDLAKWLAEVPLIGGQAELPLAEWLTFLGSPRRTGIAVGGDPLLLPRWHVPLTTSHPASQQLDQLTEELADGNVHAPLILQPAMTGGRIAFRTLHGVQVVEASTGRSLWHTEEEQPIEKLVMGNVPGTFDFGGNPFGGNPMALRRQVLVRRMGAWSNGAGFAGSGEYSPLCHLLYRNAGFGQISSDGRRLFVVDDPFALTNRQPGNAFQGDATAGVTGDDGSQLTAYDLETGRPLWEVGGPANGEPFDPPLAGYFFFGPPLADGGELLVVAECTAGEKAKQIRLLSLDPQTGAERWSQLLAYSDLATIDKDVGRRWWAAPVATENGIVVCPTTVGWLIAVDRVTRSLLWGYRVQAPGNGTQRANMPTAQVEAMAMVQNTPLNGTWSQSPPILSDGRIVWTPMESGNLVCIDQFNGKELWTKPRQNQIYVAGVHQGKVIVVGRDATTAYDLASGTQAWSLKTPSPSGRGVATRDRYLLPLSTGEVLSMNLSDGTIAHQSRLPADVRGVGNLTLYNGMLLSLDSTGLTAFEQRDAVQEEIAGRKRANPHDFQALIREAEIALLNRDYPAALQSLRGIEHGSVPGERQDALRSLLIQTLQGVIRNEFSSPEVDPLLNELATLSTTPEAKRRFHRLQTDVYLHRKSFDKAFDAYLELLSHESNLLVPRDDHASTTVRERLWVAGRISDLFDNLPQNERPKFDRRVAIMAQQALKSGADAQKQFLELFGDHPEAVIVRRQLAESLAKAGNLTQAEHQLLQLERSSAADVAASAIERRARLMRQFDLTADAGLAYTQLERQYAEVVLGNRKVRALVQELRDSGKFPVVGSPIVDWQATSIRVERSGAAHTSYVPQELSSTGSDAAFFQENRFELDQGSQRLSVADATTDELQWELPLRAHAGSHDGQPASARSTGHLLVLLHRGVLQCLAPVERKVLWSRPLDERQAIQGYYGRNTNPIQPMQASINLTNRQVYGQQMGGGWGSLAIANDDIIVCQGRRQLTAFDTQTGDVRWVYAGIRPGASIFGGRQTVYVRPADGQNCVALRTVDGKRLEVPNLAEVLNRAVDSVGDSFVMPLTGGRPGLRLFDPLTNRESWKIEYAKGTLIYPLEHDRLAILETAQAAGSFHVLDLVTGQKTQLGTVTADELKGRREMFAFSDNQNVYLVINKEANRNNYNADQIPFVRTNGTVFGFDPDQKKLRWKQAVSGQNLILERLDYSPVVLFAARTYEKQGKQSYWSLHLIAIDKLSGAKLLDEKSAAQTNFRSVSISAADRFIELRGYNDRVRLYPVEASATAGEAGD